MKLQNKMIDAVTKSTRNLYTVGTLSWTIYSPQAPKELTEQVKK